MNDRSTAIGTRHLTTAPEGESGHGRVSLWRQTVLRRADEIGMDLHRSRAGAASLDRVQKAELPAVEDLVIAARGVAMDGSVSVLEWWSGAVIERAWRLLREAEERVTDLVPAAELDVRAADALGHASFYRVPDSEPTVLHLQALRLEAATRGTSSAAALRPEEQAAHRAAIRAVLHHAHRNADRDNQEGRSLRNRLLVASLFTVLAAVALLLVQAHVSSQPFITKPVDWSASAWQLLMTVMVFGAAGALFTAIPVLSKAPTDFTPFNLPLQQAILKVVFGCLTAVVGIAALAAVQVNGLSVEPGEMTLTTFFLLAILFGAGQQSVTRYVDRRATEILEPTTTSTA